MQYLLPLPASPERTTGQEENPYPYYQYLALSSYNLPENVHRALVNARTESALFRFLRFCVFWEFL